ncbi:unnamed protein product [Amoebophrya sp. A25]|nr:unnamed protein product [Amoebophrya sp. A25]|eukprot:GSA25T00019431001.1
MKASSSKRGASSSTRVKHSSPRSPRRSTSQGSSRSTDENTTSEQVSLYRDGCIADLVTLGNAAFGMTAIFCCIHALQKDATSIKLQFPGMMKTASVAPAGLLRVAFWCLPLGGLCDILDGLVARRSGGSGPSPFGGDLDSLADLITFGVAPAVFGFVLGLDTFPDLLCLVFFVCCGVARLARFNVTSRMAKPRTDSCSSYYFEGVPIPGALWLCLLLYIDFELLPILTERNFHQLHRTTGSSFVSTASRPIPRRDPNTYDTIDPRDVVVHDAVEAAGGSVGVGGGASGTTSSSATSQQFGAAIAEQLQSLQYSVLDHLLRTQGAPESAFDLMLLRNKTLVSPEPQQLHFFSILYFLTGLAMISTIPVPKFQPCRFFMWASCDRRNKQVESKRSSRQLSTSRSRSAGKAGKVNKVRDF